MPVAAGIMAIGGVASAGIGAWGASSAANAQSQAAANSLAMQQQMYAQNSQNLTPWINTGKKATSTLADLYGLNGAGGVNAGWDAFTKLPAYTFPLDQGMLALTRKLNAEGRNMSGGAMREITQFGQGNASQYFMGNYVNPLMTMSGQGQNAASSLAGYSANAAKGMSDTYGNMGAAEAGGYLGMAKAGMAGVNNAMGPLGMYAMMNGSPSSYGVQQNGFTGATPNMPYGGESGSFWQGGNQYPMSGK